MDAEELRNRTKRLAVQIIQLVEKLPRNQTNEIIGRQLIRSATSVAANYRAVGRARSRADFINKIGIVVEEADETLFWLELLIDLKKLRREEVDLIVDETKQMVAIFTAASATARSKGK
jgi:four helix bundle protein